MQTVNIYYDTDAPNPYTEWDMVGTLVTKNRTCDGEDFNTAGQTGDPFRDFCIWLYDNGHVPYSSEWLDYPGDYTDNQYNRAVYGLENWVTHNIVWEPVYMYDHGGRTIRTSPFGCRWDSGQIGYIFRTYAEIREESNISRVSSKMVKRIESILEAEVKAIDMWLTGQVYGVVIKNEHGDHTDSLWGIYDPTPEHIKEYFPDVPTEDIEQALGNVTVL